MREYRDENEVNQKNIVFNVHAMLKGKGKRKKHTKRKPHQKQETRQVMQSCIFPDNFKIELDNNDCL